MGFGDGLKPANAITVDTFNRIIQDAGVVYLNYGLPSQKLFGVTRGGNSLTINEEQREMPTDGAPGPIKGSKRKLRSEVTLTVNLLEISTESLVAMLPGSETSQEATYDKIYTDRQICGEDYIGNVAIVVDISGCGQDGQYFVCILHNALAQGTFELGTADDDESVIPVTFMAHLDPNDLSKAPWEIRNPLESNITTYTLTYNAGANGTIFGDAVQTVAENTNGAQVVAVADTGYYFSGWDDASTSNPRTEISVTADVTVTANFTAV